MGIDWVKESYFILVAGGTPPLFSEATTSSDSGRTAGSAQETILSIKNRTGLTSQKIKLYYFCSPKNAILNLRNWVLL